MRYRTILPLATALLAACGGGSEHAESADRVEMAAPAEPGAVAQESRPAPADEALKGAQDTAGAQSAPVSIAPAMLIRTGEARLEVPALDAGIARVRALAARLGGYVGNTTMTAGRQEARAATLELKLPAERFDEALSGLNPIGRVESVSATAQDVGEEFVDLQARRTNAARLEQRLVELLATRTGRLEDVLTVERELARVREEIERYDGRLRFLRTRAAVSTLTVTLHEPIPLLGDGPGTNPIVRAVRRSWQNFVGFVAGFIELLGVLVPLAALAWAAWWIVRRTGWRRSRGA